MSTERVCSFEGCENPFVAKGLCKGHYHQWWRGKGLKPLKSRTPSHLVPTQCTFEGCERASDAKGMCSGHYQQHQKGQELRPLKVYQPGGKCSFEGCENPLHAHGLCNAHNQQRRNGKALTALWKPDWPKDCQFGGCDNPSRYLGLCIAHYQVCKNYNITPDDYHKMFESQGGVCAVCRVADPGGRGWHVDHDHACCPESAKSCGKCIRSLLCSNCNTGLGQFKDDPEILMSAIRYLESHGKVREATDA